jgi:hypothetical protein
LKKTSGDFLIVAKTVMDALDVVKQVHPFVGGAFPACQRSPSTKGKDVKFQWL